MDVLAANDTRACDLNKSIEATYVDVDGKLAKTTLQPFRVRGGQPASALSVDDPFYRIALAEYNRTVEAFNRLPVEIRKQYIALITSQVAADNGRLHGDTTPRLSAKERAECLANVMKHGISPENPFATIIKDHAFGQHEGLKRLYSVEGRPVDERKLNPVVVSFYMGTRAFANGNFCATERHLSKMFEKPRSGRASPDMN